MGREAFLAEVRLALPGTLAEEAGHALLLPRSKHEVAVTLELAWRLGGEVAAPGAVPGAGAVAMDLRRLGEVIALDETSMLAHVQAGVPVASVETELLARGLSLGLTGPATEAAVGEWLALGAPDARDHADDPVDQLVAGIEAVLPDGRELSIRPAPRRAVGPDLIGAYVGSGGKLGVIVGAHLVVRARLPGHDVAFLFPQPEQAEAARAWTRASGVRPARTRLVAVAEGTLLHLRVDGEGRLARASTDVAKRVAREHGGVPFPARDVPPPRNAEPPERSRLIDMLAERFLTWGRARS